MKTVTLVCESFYPERTAGAIRAKSIVDMFAKNRYKVNVVFLLPKGMEDIGSIPYLEKNVRLYHHIREDYSKSKFIKRLYYEIMQSMRLMRTVSSLQQDVIIVSIPFMMLLPVSAVWGVFNRKVNRVLEVRDIIWRYLQFKDGVVNKVAYFSLSLICELSVRTFDSVVTVTNRQRNNIKIFYDGNVECIGNGIDQLTLRQLSEKKGFDSNDFEPLVLTYAGSIGYPQNLLVLVKAMKILEVEGFPIVANIVGQGPEKEMLLRYCSEHMIQNVYFLESMNFDELIKVYQKSDILYGQLRKIPSLETAEPTKIFEYIATGKFVIFGAHGASSELLKNFRNVDVIEPDCEISLAISLKKVKKGTSGGDYNISFLKQYYLRENVISKYLRVL